MTRVCRCSCNLLGHQSLSFCQLGEMDSSLASGWVEDFLIEFYLEGSSGSHSTSGATEFHNEHQEQLCADGTTELQNDHEERLCANGATELHSGPEERLGVDSVTNEEAHGSYVADVEDQIQIGIVCEPQQEQSGLHASGMNECPGEALEEDEKSLELWQAQYGQVVRNDVQAEACPPAISLWNWTTLVSKRKCKNKDSVRLLGQLAQSSSRLHDSLQHGNGFIKTSYVSEVNLDLVKVTSGEIFRLRQPSLKHLSSVTLYDSSNPTKDWDFPCITLNGLEEELETASKLSPKFPIMKPFIPNSNYQRYQQSNYSKVASLAPAGLRALSEEERASLEERKRKYRDRAKERRERHDDDEEECEYGRHQTKQELMSLAKDTDYSREKMSIGKHMLERMGWCEGESIGKRNDGLIRPLDAEGNRGRAGLGWFSSRDHDGNSHCR